MDLENLEKILENEPDFRLKQANEAVFKKYISDWSDATFFTKELREKLNKECPLEILAETLFSKNQKTNNTHILTTVKNGVSGADSVKAKITLKDGLEIETVLMRHEDGRNTVCVSSQVGCPLGCLFCATGKMGFKRNLSVNEILEQAIFFNRYLKKIALSEVEGSSFGVTNVTFMGMGEPFLNYENVLKAIRILNDKNYFNIGVRSISVSTAGIVEGIEKFLKEGLQLNLAISLHAPNNKLRTELMPISKKYSLEKVLSAVDNYILATKRKVMFEYVLIKDVNDSKECAEELAKLMHNPSTPLRTRKLYFVNLILYNATGTFKPSTPQRVEVFKKILKKSGVNFVQRYRFGDDIKAACGQFATSK
ncbi:MAG: 23S rRNA (adenine(2503)-C(2))-methyltransferase [Candidatus Staskawiczbacteria bacterium RIFOXYD2_FULL_37_9]|uniref:23S rRNA (Adenine(2503)-C(2))-methyltransferase n=1 Tax=Candidatus Staskawiczbacteria bacterium RIFOXYB1_FULL_37_44 TaxID=1802223 RepID=A0A1G2IXL0_9BACT|nr:MAG: 23S rRNA (adenine(2503)-C(2))-methyltransferase [Candidatus Staskawiczbacteria bacterium RIFOXYB1_FULL_37_44]OGZ83345.1 MAG: 23S rRNA (adenine(2503)-C(2))-methyltransferase [Candidatus Staskawiczbacteria bacterium RIFOXYC1_FULL_37_52]OGZ88748.1 MAG: 23S rRNA (adenine(2503)-C(2))-methyltransferase [Candidatus Staskawiczbacteria bacterium RIFOXYD1_FULL_37_110]OGZ89490.1 MAG: 23S rRNA (adenine(2503)-C(2))-methyltransferase [Candidatus Staskawiczbacteria bacterium RIFOXYC2_FULL_37_19]OGZ935